MASMPTCSTTFSVISSAIPCGKSRPIRVPEVIAATEGNPRTSLS